MIPPSQVVSYLKMAETETIKKFHVESTHHSPYISYYKKVKYNIFLNFKVIF